MAEITTSLIKAIREKTGAGMVDCKNALVEANGDETAAIEILRKIMMNDAGFAEDDFKPIEKEIKQIVNESAEFAQSSPEPHPDELWTDILKPIE